jgi:hypothetical protein
VLDPDEPFCGGLQMRQRRAVASASKAAWAIVQRQPRVSDRIIAYNPRTVSAYFTDVCKVLGIVDLRSHDSRHEGTSQR